MPWGERLPGCSYLVPKGWPKVPDGTLRSHPVLFMVTAGRVTRVDVQAGPVATSTGIGIGNSERSGGPTQAGSPSRATCTGPGS